MVPFAGSDIHYHKICSTMLESIPQLGHIISIVKDSSLLLIMILRRDRKFMIPMVEKQTECFIAVTDSWRMGMI